LSVSQYTAVRKVHLLSQAMGCNCQLRQIPAVLHITRNEAREAVFLLINYSYENTTERLTVKLKIK